MAELRLPADSRVSNQGTVFQAPPGATRVKRFKVYRYNPDSNANPHYDTFEIDLDTCGPMILDALIKMK